MSNGWRKSRINQDTIIGEIIASLKKRINSIRKIKLRSIIDKINEQNNSNK